MGGGNAGDGARGGMEEAGEVTEWTRRHTTDGVIGSWEISRSRFLDGVSAGAEVVIMMV